VEALLFVIGEYADEILISKQIHSFFEKSSWSPEVILTVIKLFFKYCHTHSKEEVKDLHSKLLSMLQYCNTDSVETYEMLNFYYGVLKEWDTLCYDEVVTLINKGFTEESIKSYEVQDITKEEIKIDMKELEVMKKSSLLIFFNDLVFDLPLLYRNLIKLIQESVWHLLLGVNQIK